MTSSHRSTLLGIVRHYLRPSWRGSVSDWCRDNIRFDEPNNSGPFSLLAREYITEPLDAIASYPITDLVIVFGSQSGKTGLLMGGIAWLLVHDPSRVLWVMPSIRLAENFAETRWLPMLRASTATRPLLPTGAKRHAVKKSQQALAGSIVTFIGSNSPASLASTPARILVMDETDKFARGNAREANAIELAEQRTKKFACPKRIKCSTPTLVDGLIWQQFLAGDQRRYYLPCPGCGLDVLLAFSQEATVLSRTGKEAWLKWDQDARRPDGSWDMERVSRSTYAECPHCHCHIPDAAKTRMLRAGHWQPTSNAPANIRSYHLSSLYAVGTQTTFGAVAVRFLLAKQSLLGLQGFINGDLAEPWESQDTRSERHEIIANPDQPLPEALPLMTVDVQAAAPYYWLVCRAWTQAGASRLLWAGHCDDWETVRRLQLACGVQDNHVCVDSGSRTTDVYQACLRWGRAIARNAANPLWVGWTPGKGRERSAWLHPQTKVCRPFMLGAAALPANTRIQLPLLEFAGEYLLDLLSRLRKGQAGISWELIPMPTAPPVDGAVAVDSEEYYRHLDAKIYRPIASGRTGKVDYRWCKRSDRWPDHLLDCEIMQIAMALLHKRLPLSETPKPAPQLQSQSQPQSQP